MKDILVNALYEVAIVIIAALGGAIIAFLRAKISSINSNSSNELANRIRWEVESAVEDAVMAVNQTFVEELKKKNLFDKEAQEEAFDRALDGTLKALSQSTVEFINNTYGDITIWLKDKIEAAVNRNKK
ncbi:MAG: hypothetical protein SPK43_05385 [Candidatus Onthovivens sp.]|nr:hypothetical protein [Candidatus Onthovivens sp.]